MSEVMFSGVEYDLLLFDILVYSLIDLAGNSMLSVVITYLVDLFICKIRQHYGQKNISQKNLVDERFLL